MLEQRFRGPALEARDAPHRARLAHEEDLVAAHGEDLAGDVLRLVGGAQGHGEHGHLVGAHALLHALARAASLASSLTGMVAIMRVQAKGAMTLERTFFARLPWR
jgi:hypothetical protein